jgi:hypothetical protein
MVVEHWLGISGASKGAAIMAIMLLLQTLKPKSFTRPLAQPRDARRVEGDGERQGRPD